MQASAIRKHLLSEVEYPLRFRSQNLLKTAVVQFCILFFFLLLFKPFGVYEPEYRMSYLIICALHALIPTLIVYLYFTVLNVKNKGGYKPHGWMPLKEYAHIAVILLLTGIGSFLLRGTIYNNALNWSARYLWEEIRNCYLVGCLFYFYLSLASFYFQSKKKAGLVDKSFPLVCKEDAQELGYAEEVFIKTQVQQDDFSFKPAELLFAKADGNYIELAICSNGNLTTGLKRISLKQFEVQVAHYSFLFRCHRAYLVNLMQVKNVSGNSQGYLLSLDHAQERIPVSRAQLDSFNSLYEQFAPVLIA